MITLKNMVKENKNQEFRLKNKEETRNYFIEEISNNELMSKSTLRLYFFKLY